MGHANRLFLLGLAALPALHCKDDEPTLQEQCVDALTAYYECLGYAYNQAEFEAAANEYCSEFNSYADVYGEDCVQAQLDIMTCISQLGCAMSDDFTMCGPAVASAHDKCPELFGTCLVITEGGGGGMTSCGRSGSQCIDGNEYGVACNDGTGTLTCTCTINGEEVGTYAPADGCGDSFTDEAVEACGFPQSTP